MGQKAVLVRKKNKRPCLGGLMIPATLNYPINYNLHDNPMSKSKLISTNKKKKTKGN